MPLVDKFLLSVDSVWSELPPVLLTRHFSSSQKFSIMFKSNDFGGKSSTWFAFS